MSGNPDAELLEAGRKMFAGDWQFIWASPSIDTLPPMKGVEVAFAGRSNVGKSSLINALTGRNALARTSHTPGRTQELIFFDGPSDQGRSLRLVDMPGYGYAAASKTKVASWTTLIHSFLQGRANLARVYVLIDSRHGFKDVDNDVLMKRLTGRRTCAKCGATFNIYLTNSKSAGKYDKCGGALQHRSDDNEATVKSRLQVYQQQTQPLVAYYKAQGKLRTVRGVGSINEIFKNLSDIVEAQIRPLAEVMHKIEEEEAAKAARVAAEKAAAKQAAKDAAKAIAAAAKAKAQAQKAAAKAEAKKAAANAKLAKKAAAAKLSKQAASKKAAAKAVAKKKTKPSKKVSKGKAKVKAKAKAKKTK